MSIHPKYALGVILGIKRIEWRKRSSFEDLDHFLNSYSEKKILLYVTNPVKSANIVVQISKILIDKPYQIFKHSEVIAGISVLELIDYYGKDIAVLLEQAKHETIDFELLNFGEQAYALCLQHCYLLDEAYNSKVLDFIKDSKVLKGIKSVQKINLELDDNFINKRW